MSERIPLVEDEWYHCFTRGIDKRPTFKERSDYDRFLQQMHLSNTPKSLHRSNMRNHSLQTILQLPLTNRYVAIGAFCLMPNHFHLILKPLREKGISAFMQKLGTAYTMYFNIKYERTGGLFVSPFKSKHLGDDRYFQYAIQYLHCNPAEIYEPKWKEGNVRNIDSLERRLLRYPFSSFGLFFNKHHVLRSMIDPSIFAVATQSAPRKMLDDAREYYESMHQGEALMHSN
jgi:putative transposase